MGGGSSINYQAANRGTPDDYNEWDEMGATGWDWDNVLQYFRKLERDEQFDGDFHGRSGPLPIRRVFRRTGQAFPKQQLDHLLQWVSITSRIRMADLKMDIFP